MGWFANGAVLGGVAFLALAPGGARAALVQAAFEGTIESVEGTIPGGGIAVGTAFSGSIVYSSETTTQQAVSGFVDPLASLSLDVPGRSYESDDADPRVHVAINVLTVDALAGEVVEGSPCNEQLPPDQFICAHWLQLESERNRSLEGAEYTLSFELLSADPFIDLTEGFEGRGVPTAGQLVAALNGDDGEPFGGTVAVLGDGFGFEGAIESARLIPEPSTALLLGGGLLSLGFERRRGTLRKRFRRDGESPRCAVGSSSPGTPGEAACC